jgi:hypothetical protein
MEHHNSILPNDDLRAMYQMLSEQIQKRN